VDTLGLLWLVKILTGNVQERDGGKILLAAVEALKALFPRLKLIWADGGFAGQLEEWVTSVCAWVLEIVRKVKATGFEVLPHRWVVERTFGWFANYRRLDKDYEVNPVHSEATLYWAMTHRMARRLTGGQVQWKPRAP
jgi:putative transposase